MADDAAPTKPALRAAIRAALADLPDDERARASIRACGLLLELDELRAARVVLLYLPITGEIDVAPAAARLLERKVALCVPRVDWEVRTMDAVPIGSLDAGDLEVGRHGVRAPRAASLLDPSTVDAAVVPGRAFDRAGRRLGRGGGYYDRFLTGLRSGAARIGLCFARQLVPLVPTDERDVAMDVVVTDAEVIRA